MLTLSYVFTWITLKNSIETGSCILALQPPPPPRVDLDRPHVWPNKRAARADPSLCRAGGILCRRQLTYFRQNTCRTLSIILTKTLG